MSCRDSFKGGFDWSSFAHFGGDLKAFGKEKLEDP